MIKLAWGTSFRRAFKRYTRSNLARQKRVLQTLDKLAHDPFHPTLKAHKLSGQL